MAGVLVCARGGIAVTPRPVPRSGRRWGTAAAVWRVGPGASGPPAGAAHPELLQLWTMADIRPET